MKPVYQTRGGPNGNCYAACVASILECDLTDVPDLRSDREYWASKLEHFTRTIYAVTPVWALGGNAPPGYAIAGQLVYDGSIHSVVCLNGKRIHDPSVRPIGDAAAPVQLWTTFEAIK